MRLRKKLAKTTKGAIQELRVSIDLLNKGYEVFMAVSPACSCDLLALKNGKIDSFEVRTAREYKTSGKYNYPKKGIKASHIALALTNKLVYIPELK